MEIQSSYIFYSCLGIVAYNQQGNVVGKHFFPRKSQIFLYILI